MLIMRTTPFRDTQAPGTLAGAGRSVAGGAGSDDKSRRHARRLRSGSMAVIDVA
jgi:hypothetical protein